MYLINGKEVKKDDFNISVEDLVVWRGDGIFEAIRIHGGFLYALDKHMERFKNSAKKMYFENIDFIQIEKDLIEVASNFDTGYMRVIIGRGDSIDDFNIYIFHQEPVSFPESYSLESQKAHWMSGGDFQINEIHNIAAKTTSYAMNMNQTRLAEKNGFTDALLINRDGVVLEGPSFSIGWINNGEVFVPDLDLGILDSVTRRCLIEIGEGGAFSISEKRISIDELYKVDTVFILSTAKHAIFVNKIDEVEYSKDPLVSVIKDSFKIEIEKEKPEKL